MGIRRKFIITLAISATNDFLGQKLKVEIVWLKGDEYFSKTIFEISPASNLIIGLQFNL